MDVYLIRHGQTDGNLALRHQHVDTELNEEGKRQIQLLTEVVAEIKPTHIITSTNLRAVETTRLIVQKCPYLIPETSSMFEELRRPSWLTGNRFVSLVTVSYIWRWFFGYKIEGGGESYGYFLKRVIEARIYLESLPNEARVVVVSHSVFINFFLEHLCSDEKISFWRACRRLMKILTLQNGSVIHLKHNALESKCDWEVVG